MHDLKAPCLNGLPVVFYKKCLHIVGNHVIKVQELFITDYLKEGWNHTFITLIPKVTNHIASNDYRPITLFNVVYKIISRRMVKTLKPILQENISPFLADFLLGRWIVENTLIARETAHTVSRKKRET